MNIDELDNFNLDDAIRFHNQLNPGLWDQKEHLRPEVREALLRIADDFREFLGVQDLQVKDITMSGSNAAYTYTPHSDIDLHLVVDIPELYDPVYRELFNAKKYEYNDRHNIRVRDADVELYVQPSDDTHHSQGIYSIKDNKWIQVPRRRKATVDDLAVRHKYEDLVARIDQAIKDSNNESAAALMKKIRNMRQTGLDQHGEFGAENLAFKMLRSQGYIKKLSDAVAAAKDRELSLKERKKPKKKKRYGYGGYWYPGFSWGDSSGSSEGGDGGGGGESVREDAGSTWDGVSPTTCMFTNEADSEDSRRDIIKKFAGLCAQHLKLKKIPRIILKKTPQWSEETGSFGQYQPDEHTLILSLPGRHILDVLRTMAHELTHAQQEERVGLPVGAGDTGSPWENEANARAGILMRHFAERHPEYFSNVSIAEASGYIPTRAQAKDPRFSMALTADIQPGELGRQANKLGLQTDSQGRPALLMKSLAQQLREYKETPRKKSLVIFDIDDTLLHTTAKIRVVSRGRVVRELTNQQFNHYKLQPDEEFDFGEFRNAEKFNRESEPIKPMVRKLKTILINSPNSDVIMLTARADFDDKELFLKTFRDLGIDMSRVHVHRAGNLPGDAIPAEKKAVWVRKYLNTDQYDHVRLYDDSVTNLTVFKELRQEYPGVDFRAVYVGPEGTTKAIEEDEESYEIDDGNDPPGPESPPKFPAGTVKVDVSDVYDWYKLGQGISDIDDMNKKDFGQGPPSTVLAFGSEDLEHQYIKALKSLGLPVHDLDEPGEEDLDEAAGVDLFEINMSPSNLRKMAAKTGAIAGMEFEMYVPGAAEADEDEYGSEPDYEMDESFPTGRGYQSEVIDFFRGGDGGSPRSTIQRALDVLSEDYWSWKEENFEEWLNDNDTLLDYYLREELPQEDDESDEEYIERLGSDDEEVRQAQDRAMDRVREEHQNEDQFEEFLQDADIRSMADFGSNYDVEWPYYTYPESSGGSIDIDDVASDFQSAIGRRVSTGGYHSGASSQTNNYRVETDSSLSDPANPEDGGLEFISPPLPLDEMLSDLDKVVKWAQRNDCYTNDTTGLHMNVSVPGFELSKLDYVKLAIFLGDEYVLDQFGRAGNTYCASAMENIRKIARMQPDKVLTMLEQMQGNLSAMASKIVHTGNTNKYTSINTKDGYIEFRSPGGDWLDEYANNEDKINNTLLRFTVALDIAMKPELYRQEYMKKLYKTLSLGESNDTIQFFARYAAGDLPQSALKSFVKQAQIQRKAKKLLPGAIKGKSLIQWQATSGAATTKVVARTEEEARKKAAVNIGIPFTDSAIDRMDIQPLDLYTGPVNQYTIVKDSNGTDLGDFEGIDERDAITNFRVQKPQWSNTDVTARLVTSTPTPPDYPAATSNTPGSWTIMNQSTRNMLQGVGGTFIYASRAAREIAQDNNIRRAEIRIINTDNGQVFDIDGNPARYGTESNTRGGGFSRAPHTSIYQVINGRSGRVWFGGETRTFAGTVELANRAIEQHGLPAADVRIVDLNTNTVYNLDGSLYRSAPAAQTEQLFNVRWTDENGEHDVNRRAPNADAAMDDVRNSLESGGFRVASIEANPIGQTQGQAQGSESLPSGQARWLILDRNDREVYSFVGSTAQRDANDIARNWLTANAQDGQGPFTVVPVT